MIEYKINVSKYVPVQILNSSGVPVAGIAFGSVTAAVVKADGTTATLTVTITDWTEVTTGAFSGAGFYLLKLPASAVNQAGMLDYAVASGANKVYIGTIKVVDNEEVDTFSRLGAPVLASHSADVAGVKTDVAGVLTAVSGVQTTANSSLTILQLLQKFEKGRWKIHITGTDVNRLVLYDTDNTTVLLKFDLKDSGGSATFTNPFERLPVP